MRVTERVPALPVIARVRPANTASQRVVVRVGLVRAEHLDIAGEKGLDWIFVKNVIWLSRVVMLSFEFATISPC
ncbi:hypothetical protein [Nonomuraea sp. NPDC005650]|uniref:hypothetical protein n=1 Tax=Nonomuraea sp. NPDC005650 TaxID=3157045 RepID=UPI0033A43B78